ncbi:GTPase [Methylotuvimicrobium sp. KM2]|uniref:GTPase n=1 Tax=Methylotuvimicrobium sp. KM2 TaxID=3133976 RepID=UPI0031017644
MNAEAKTLAENLLEKLKRGKDRRLSFLLTGRTGVGKSSTVNSLIGKDVARVGDYEATTMSVETYDSELNGIKFTVIDTPGLCDDIEEAENDEKYLGMIKSKIRNFDCLWFVTRLDETRVSSDEKRGIKLISEAFGPHVWEHAIIVFTFACKVGADKYEEAFMKRTDLIRKEIARHSEELIASEIPSVAVDNHSHTIPNGTEWLGELYTKIWQRISKSGAAPFLLATTSSVKPKEPGTEARIKLTPEQKREVKKQIDAKVIPGLAAAGAGIGAAFGPVGAAIGGTIGATVGLVAWLWD